MTTDITAPTALETVRRRRRRRRRSSLVVWFLTLALAFVVTIAIVGPWLPLPSPNAQSLTNRLQPPVFAGGSWDHPLGTDGLGRDMLARLTAGTRLTMLVAFTSVLIGGLIGVTAGTLSGLRRGWVDTVISRVIDAQLAIPFLLLAIAVITARGRSLGVLIFVLAIFVWARYARLVRSDAIGVAARPFITALRAAGVPTRRIIVRHLLPNIGGTVLVITTLEIGMIIIGESALSFLGLGVVAPDVSWGSMLAEGREDMRRAWWVVAAPGAAITSVVLIVNLLGDVLHARHDPRKRVVR